MEPEAQIRNLRDFLMVYNRMTEICFRRCTSNFNYRTLTMDEERCADSCAGKLIRSNHRLMGTYVNLMPGMVQRRMAEMEKKNAELAGVLEGEGVLEGAGVPNSPAMGEQPPVRSSSIAMSDVIPVVAPPTTPGLADAGLPLASTPGEAPPTSSSSPAPLASTTEVSMATMLDNPTALTVVPPTYVTQSPVITDKGTDRASMPSLVSFPLPSSPLPASTRTSQDSPPPS